MPPPPPVPPPPLSVPKAAPHAPGGVSGSSDASLLQLDEDEGGSWANGPTSHTSRTTSATSTSQRAVERCDYRLKELRQNNITLLRTRDQLPSHVQSLINTISQARSSPGPTDTDIIKDDWLEALELGADESMVGSYWTTYFVTPPRPFDSIASSANHLIHKRFVPHIDGICKLSTPKPDLLYGYQDTGAFPSPAYQRLLSDTSFHTDCQNILFPFLAVEFKGTLSGGKDMWVATNQCLGAGAALVNAAEILVEQAQGQSKVQSNGQSASCSFETSAFTIAFDGVEARIFITWLDRDTQIFCTKRVETFHILHPHSYRRLRSLVRNIMAWGAGTRLDGILKLFDAISAATAAGTTDIPGPSGETSVGIHGPRKRTRPVFRGSNAGRSRGRSSSSRRTGPHTSQQDHTSEIID
ncbi:hypothetical protein BD289DRAFT_374679 [Coniella lustricola]|uniref:DUF7924 domain-containing protein n=1 Tax=Coniella lustricola TaxID=2025994 RepID=A0A2T2ZZE4_9PEZI|nr:hypothetical protein BD289DRAFT_374679 [Coniella lustricola]